MAVAERHPGQRQPQEGHQQHGMAEAMNRGEADIGNSPRLGPLHAAVLQHIDQAAAEPHERMQPEETEGQKQERQHRRVNRVYQRTPLAVDVIDVRIEVDEAARRVWVALVAGGIPVLRRERRFGI